MTQTTDQTSYIFVPLHVKLYAELIQRSGKADVSVYINNIVTDFLDRTEGDAQIWSSEYIEKIAEKQDEEFVDRYGDPSRGYQWQTVYLPNGTQIRMTYRGDSTYGEVRHGKLFLGEESMSPSEFARHVANNTSRNAWRDIYVKFPGDGGWLLADDLRRQNR